MVAVGRSHARSARRRLGGRRLTPHGAGDSLYLVHFVNADLIAGGISPLRPELAAIAAGRIVLRELNRLAEAKAEFTFESTLSGLHYAKRLDGTHFPSKTGRSIWRP